MPSPPRLRRLSSCTGDRRCHGTQHRCTPAQGSCTGVDQCHGTTRCIVDGQSTWNTVEEEEDRFVMNVNTTCNAADPPGPHHWTGWGGFLAITSHIAVIAASSVGGGAVALLLRCRNTIAALFSPSSPSSSPVLSAPLPGPAASCVERSLCHVARALQSG